MKLTSVYIRTYICVHTSIYVYTYVCMYICLYACICIYMYVCKKKTNKQTNGSNKIYTYKIYIKKKNKKYTDTPIHKYFFLALSPAPPQPPFFCHCNMTETRTRNDITYEKEKKIRTSACNMATQSQHGMDSQIQMH